MTDASGGVRSSISPSAGSTPRVEVRAPAVLGADRVLTPDALRFVAELVARFGPQISERLARRPEFHRRILGGKRPEFLPESRAIRDADWQVRAPPVELADRRVEITGPPDRKMVIHALNSGARVYMADFEDAHSPTWERTVEGQANLIDAVHGTISYPNPDGSRLELTTPQAVLFVRPRGLHLPERHIEVDGRPIPGCLFDFGIYFYHNARELLAHGHAPYFYLAKLEHRSEAALWEAVFRFAEERFDLPLGTIRATVLIETFPAVFEAEEILYELREHSAGLNGGRWDYIFSFLKEFRDDPSVLFPDRAELTMDRPFLAAYARHLVRTCHRRGAHAIGGMAPLVPIKDDPEANVRAIAAVIADKEREVALGHDGTWVAHPGLVAVAQGPFDRAMPGPNQIGRTPLPEAVVARELLEVPRGPVTEVGVRTDIHVSVRYLEAWLRGIGCVPIDHRMEDAATVEIARAQLRQWVRRGVPVPPGGPLDVARVRALVDEEVGRLSAERRRDGGEDRSAEAAAVLMELVAGAAFQEFFTLRAYDLLERTDRGGGSP